MRKSCIEIKGCGHKMHAQNVTCKHCDPAGNCAHPGYQEAPQAETNCIIDLYEKDQIRCGFEKLVKPLIQELTGKFAVGDAEGSVIDDANDEGPSVSDIVKDYLDTNGYDGLIDGEGCGCDGSAPCVDGPYSHCRAAFAGPGGKDVDGQSCDVLYYATKASVKEAQRIKEEEE